ncbi:MAG: hypothetical protein HZB33_04085 [Nitrospirae bacterium]|nr:hypothetical protein [Nitrospirota bacterium]
MKWILAMILFPAISFGSENCVTQYHGTCRESCLHNEEVAEGAFIDCSDKEECCVKKAGADRPAENKGSLRKDKDIKPKTD